MLAQGTLGVFHVALTGNPYLAWRNGVFWINRTRDRLYELLRIRCKNSEVMINIMGRVDSAGILC